MQFDMRRMKIGTSKGGRLRHNSRRLHFVSAMGGGADRMLAQVIGKDVNNQDICGWVGIKNVLLLQSFKQENQAAPLHKCISAQQRIAIASVR